MTEKSPEFRLESRRNDGGKLFNADAPEKVSFENQPTFISASKGLAELK